MSRRKFTCADHELWSGDYVVSVERAERLVVTHVQRRCSECGLWRIWIPKPEVASVETESDVPKGHNP